MRGELPQGFREAAEGAAPRPVNLAVFKFQAGPVYLSDRDLGPEQGLSETYEGLVRDWGQLSDLPLSESDVAETRELTLTIWNGAEPPFSRRFLAQDPESVEVELWQWFEGTPESARVLVDLFAVSDPVIYSEADRELRLDLVSLSVRHDCLVGEPTFAEEFPNAPEESIGKTIPLLFGSLPGLPCTCVAAAPETTLARTVMPGDTLIEVEDAGSFPASGAVQIDDEQMLYRSRTASSFSVTKRGHGNTAAVDHLGGRAVTALVDHVFLVGKGPLKAISEVRVAGLPPETPYTVHPEQDPALIVFSGPPRVARLSEGTRFLEMQFDAVLPESTARLPHLAIDDSQATTAAEIDQAHPLLALVQATLNPDRGAIRQVWLGVEHWESERLPHDRVEVEVSGLGTQGRLSAPHPQDAIAVEADVDIDHGHSHSLIAEHTHAFTDRQEVLREESHAHSVSGPQQFTGQLSNNQIKGWAYSFDAFGNKIYWAGLDQGQYVTVTFQGVPSTGKAWLEVSARKCPVFLGQYPRGTYTDGRLPCGGLGGGDKLLDIDCQHASDVVVGRYSLAAPVSQLYLSAERKYCWSATYGYAEVVSVKQFVSAEDVAPVKTGVSLQVLDPGRNLSVNPLTGGVDSLATANVSLGNMVESKASQTAVDFFDLTRQVAGDWGWFSGREVRLRYVGNQDQRTCYVRHVWFEVEYSPREVECSSEVTCRVEGLIDDAQGSLTGTPGGLITRPDHVRRYLLTRVAGLPAERLDTGSFGAAGARYAALGYRFDLCVAEQTSLKELEVGLARQCRSRFYWDAGTARIAVRERDAALAPAVLVGPEMVLLDSMRAERSRVSDLANRIRLCYRKDLGSAEMGAAGYLAALKAEAPASVAAVGWRERPEDFCFEAVRDPAMATDLLAFYLEKEGRLTTTYTFDCFLDLFGLEKEDALRLSHPFDGLSKHLAVVRSATRLLGSGQAGRPDLVRVQAELLPRRALSEQLSETVRALEVLSNHKGTRLHLADQAHPAELARLAWGLPLAEQAQPADSLGYFHDAALELADFAATDEGLRISQATPTGLREDLFCEERLFVSVSQEQAAGLSEGALTADALAASLHFAPALQASTSATDSLEVSLAAGFGTTPFGTTPYGR